MANKYGVTSKPTARAPQHPGYLLVELASFEDVQLTHAQAQLLLAALQSSQATKATNALQAQREYIKKLNVRKAVQKQSSTPSQTWRNLRGLWQ